MSRKVELVRLGADEGETLPGPPPRFRPAADVFNKDNKRMKRADEETIKKALGSICCTVAQACCCTLSRLEAAHARFSTVRALYTCRWTPTTDNAFLQQRGRRRSS